MDWAHSIPDEATAPSPVSFSTGDLLPDRSAHCISLDFFDRPTSIATSADVVRDLTELRARYGYREDFLSREQRHQILTGIFGADEDASGADSFSALRDQLLAAVAAFVERVFNTSEQMLRAAVRIMHVYIEDYPSRT